MYETSDYRRAALRPKRPWRKRHTAAMPALPDYFLRCFAAKLAPAEHKALAEICENADLIIVDGKQFLLAPVSDRTMDALAAFGAAAEDRENDLCDEFEEDDDTADYEHDEATPTPIGAGSVTPYDPEPAPKFSAVARLQYHHPAVFDRAGQGKVVLHAPDHWRHYWKVSVGGRSVPRGTR